MTHLLFIGDSLIAGYNWQSRIPQWKTETLGVPGATAQDILKLLPNITVPAPPDVILLMVGTNNLYKEDYDFTEALKAVIQFCNQQYPEAEILLNNIFPMTLDHLSPETIETVNEHIKRIAIQTGCCLLDMHRRFTVNSANKLFQDDNIHLTDAGYELWSRTILEHIAFLIESD